MNHLKKKILINIHYLEIGGAETSLIGLLHSLTPENFNVDLLINDPRGELMKYIPDWVNIIPVPKSYNYIERPIKDTLKAGQLKIVFARLYSKYKFSKYFKKNKPKDGNAIFGYVGKYTSKVLPALKYLGEYDVAISYVTPHNIVADKIRAKRKLAWIHTDYSKVDVNADLELPVWNSYNYIVSISPDVTKAFLSVFPSLKNKIVEIENFLPIELIKNKSLEFVPNGMAKDDKILKILTIGRFCEAKRIDEIPEMAKTLKASGVLFKWFIIGYGFQEEIDKIKRNILDNKVEEDVILLGKKENPYPYIKNCDIYVQPSRFEGKSITVREAQFLGKPVVISDYPTAVSQIKHKIDGYIGPYETKLLGEYLVKIINGKNSLNNVIENLCKADQTQQVNMQKFLCLLNNYNKLFP